MNGYQQEVLYKALSAIELIVIYIADQRGIPTKAARDAEFEENKHPRKKDGKFAPKGQEESSAETKSQNKNPDDKITRRVYGNLAAGGGNYTIQLGDEYRGEERLPNGKALDEYSAHIPPNKTDNLQLYATPYSHKYVPNSIMSNGRVVLNSSVMNGGNRWNTIRSMVETEAAMMGGAIKEGVYYRGTDNPKELEIAKKKQLRPSVNHRTDQKEDGVSVWEKMNYASHQYTYKIKGKIIGTGSDGEPLLDPSSIEVVSKLEPTLTMYSEYQEKLKNGEELFKEKYGWSQSQINAARGKMGPESSKVETIRL